MTEPAGGVPFARAEIVPEAQQAAVDVLRSGWITMGPQTAKFEQELASYLGAPHVVAVASCTAAIEIALRALRLGRGAAVLTPSLTFCGAVAPIVQAGLRPVLVDVDPDTFLPTPATVEQAARRAGRPGAMIIQHMAGSFRPARWLRTRHTGSAPNCGGAGLAAVPARRASASTRPRIFRSAKAARSPPTTMSWPGTRVRRGCTASAAMRGDGTCRAEAGGTTWPSLASRRTSPTSRRRSAGPSSPCCRAGRHAGRTLPRCMTRRWRACQGSACRRGPPMAGMPGTSIRYG